MRENPDLDSVLGDVADVDSVKLPKAKRRRQRPGLARDQVRRLAFKVLALLSGLPARDRQRVLLMAGRLNTAG